MPKAEVMREHFFTPNEGEFLVNFIERHHGVTTWKPQSVVILAFTPEHQYLALCLPHKASDRAGTDLLRIPVQGRVHQTINVLDEARLVFRERAGIILDTKAFSYIGFGYTDHHHGGHKHPFNKLLHFVSCVVPNRKLLPNRTAYADVLEWHHVSAIPGLAASVMSDRKAWLLNEALTLLAAQHTAVAPRLRTALAS